MEVTRIFDLLSRGKEIYISPVLSAKANGNWIGYSIDEYIEYSNSLSYAFLSLGMEKVIKLQQSLIIGPSGILLIWAQTKRD